MTTETTTETVAVPPAKLAKVKLIGNDGNAFAIMGACKRAARDAKYTKEQIDQYLKESMSGDYDHLLGTAMKWFDVR
jgi:hypothetical protein